MRHHFETHLTLAVETLPGRDQLLEWTAARGLKWTQIVLDRGSTPYQPMVTYWGRGSLEQQQDLARELAAEIARLGATVVRIKIETPIDDGADPAPDRTVLPEAVRYFEVHFKLLLDEEADLQALSVLAGPHWARISRNDRRQREDGLRERFVTQRSSGGDVRQAMEARRRLQSALHDAGYTILEVESESVVFDSNLSLDAGWLTQEGMTDVV